MLRSVGSGVSSLMGQACQSGPGRYRLASYCRAMRTVFRSDDPDVNPYKLLTAVVVPRPIAWISTIDRDGVGNLAPHSFFNVACANPPIVSFTSVGGKDTLANVLATGVFVVNLATEPLLEQVN